MAAVVTTRILLVIPFNQIDYEVNLSNLIKMLKHCSVEVVRVSLDGLGNIPAEKLQILQTLPAFVLAHGDLQQKFWNSSIEKEKAESIKKNTVEAQLKSFNLARIAGIAENAWDLSCSNGANSQAGIIFAMFAIPTCFLGWSLVSTNNTIIVNHILRFLKLPVPDNITTGAFVDTESFLKGLH